MKKLMNVGFLLGLFCSFSLTPAGHRPQERIEKVAIVATAVRIVNGAEVVYETPCSGIPALLVDVLPGEAPVGAFVRGFNDLAFFARYLFHHFEELKQKAREEDRDLAAIIGEREARALALFRRERVGSLAVGLRARFHLVNPNDVVHYPFAYPEDIQECLDRHEVAYKKLALEREAERHEAAYSIAKPDGSLKPGICAVGVVVDMVLPAAAVAAA